MKILLINILLLVSLNNYVIAEETNSNDPNVIIEYKQYENIDLGDLEIQGEVIAPGDLSASKRGNKQFSQDLLERTHFDDYVQNDVHSLR